MGLGQSAFIPEYLSRAKSSHIYYHTVLIYNDGSLANFFKTKLNANTQFLWDRVLCRLSCKSRSIRFARIKFFSLGACSSFAIYNNE